MAQSKALTEELIKRGCWTCMKISRPVRMPLRLRSASSSSRRLCACALRSSRHRLNVCARHALTSASQHDTPSIYCASTWCSSSREHQRVLSNRSKGDLVLQTPHAKQREGTRERAMRRYSHPNLKRVLLTFGRYRLEGFVARGAGGKPLL